MSGCKCEVGRRKERTPGKGDIERSMHYTLQLPWYLSYIDVVPSIRLCHMRLMFSILLQPRARQETNRCACHETLQLSKNPESSSASPSNKESNLLLVKSSCWRDRALTKLLLCARISNNRGSTGLNSLSTHETPPSTFIAASYASVFAMLRARFRRTRTALRGIPAARFCSST